MTVDAIESSLRIDSVAESCKVLESAPFIGRLAVKLSAQQRAAAWREVEAYLRGLGEGSVVTASTQSLIAGGVA